MWGHQVWALRLLSFFLLLPDRVLCSGHDVSDGGLITCLLEMAFAGNCGIQVDIPAPGVDGEPRIRTQAWDACPTCGTHVLLKNSDSPSLFSRVSCCLL